MTPSEGSMMSTETVSRYLDDVARMLGDADPAYRAEVLAGVHDHLEAALGPEPWREVDVRQALDQLGPPEEIAEAALGGDGQRQVPEPRPAFMARAWVPPVAVTTMAIGLLGVLWLFSRFYAFYPGLERQVFVSLPEPFGFLRGVLWLFVLPTTWLVIAGALLVAISPLYRGVDRMAAWLAVPWIAAVFELATFALRATCARSGSGSCTGVDSQTARVAMVAALTIAAIGAVLLLIRLGRGRTMSRSGATRWWTATAVALGLLISALPIVLLPLTYREGTYVSRGVDGLVAYPWTFGATLVPVLVVVPVWILTLVLLVRSPLWTRTTKVIGVALLPALLAAVSAITVAPTSLSPTVMTAGTAVAIASAAAAIIAVMAIFLNSRRASANRPSQDR